jgi:hypothetical protein
VAEDLVAEARTRQGKSVFVATALAGALLLGGCVAAASPAPSVTTASLTSGTTSIVSYADSDVAASTVVLTGAIGDFSPVRRWMASRVARPANCLPRS